MKEYDWSGFKSLPAHFSFFCEITRDFRDFSQDELSDDVKFIFLLSDWMIGV